MTAPSHADEQPFSHDGSDVGVLLCHGFPDSPGSMRAWADHLVAEGYSVRLPLLPGHGTRWQDAIRTTFDDWLASASLAAPLRMSCAAECPDSVRSCTRAAYQYYSS